MSNPDKDLFDWANEGDDQKGDDFSNLVPPTRGQEPVSQAQERRELVGAGGPTHPAPSGRSDAKDRKKLETAYIMVNVYANIFIRKGLLTQRELDKEVEEVMKEYLERGGI